MTVTWKNAGDSALAASDFAHTVLTDDEGKTWGFNTAHELVEAQPGVGNNRGIVVSVALSYTGTNADLAAYVGNYTATINHGEDRLKIIKATSAPAVSGTNYADANPAVSFGFTIEYDNGESAYVLTGASKTIFVAISGTDANHDDTWAKKDTTSLSGTLSVSVAANV